MGYRSDVLIATLDSATKDIKLPQMMREHSNPLKLNDITYYLWEAIKFYPNYPKSTT